MLRALYAEVAPWSLQVHHASPLPPSSMSQFTEKFRTVRIGLAGLGNVGMGVFKNLRKNAGLIKERTGCLLQVEKIVVRSADKNRGEDVPAAMLTTDWRQLVSDPRIDVIVELIGGTTDAFELVCESLRAKKPVVTGNKALLAERGQELFKLAEENHVPIYFEAAVAGEIGRASCRERV